MKRVNDLVLSLFVICIACLGGSAHATITVSSSQIWNTDNQNYPTIACNKGDIIIVAEVTDNTTNAPSPPAVSSNGRGFVFSLVDSVTYNGTKQGLYVWKLKAPQAFSNQPPNPAVLAIDTVSHSAVEIDVISGGNDVEAASGSNGLILSYRNQLFGTNVTTVASGSRVFGYCGLQVFQGTDYPKTPSGFSEINLSTWADSLSLEGAVCNTVSEPAKTTVPVDFGAHFIGVYFFWYVIGISISPA